MAPGFVQNWRNIVDPISLQKRNALMWKKALWVYLGLYVLGMLGVLVYQLITQGQSGGLDWVSALLYLFILLPALVVALELRGKRVAIFFTLLGLLIVAAPVAGILNFNKMGLDTIGKVLLFVPMIIGLIYYGFIRRPARK
jgi:hypothetical protein